MIVIRISYREAAASLGVLVWQNGGVGQARAHEEGAGQRHVVPDQPEGDVLVADHDDDGEGRREG